MKVLVVTCIEEMKIEIIKIFKSCGVKVFSASATTGFRDDESANIMDDWFGSKEGEFGSVMLFSFTDEQSASNAIREIDEFNSKDNSGYPAHAFILPVEAYAGKKYNL